MIILIELWFFCAWNFKLWFVCQIALIFWLGFLYLFYLFVIIDYFSYFLNYNVNLIIIIIYFEEKKEKTCEIFGAWRHHVWLTHSSSRFRFPTRFCFATAYPSILCENVAMIPFRWLRNGAHPRINHSRYQEERIFDPWVCGDQHRLGETMLL